MSLRKLLRSWRGRSPSVGQAQWSRALDYCRYAQALPAAERRRLRDTMARFLKTKHIHGAADFEPSAEVHTVIALKACVPVLQLGLEEYASWSDIIVYPGDFRVNEEYMDEAGIVHRQTRDLCGQALNQGPIVLSWENIVEERELLDRDVVIHECVHKLDIANGPADGFPPLPPGLSAKQWSGTLSSDYDRFCRAVEAGADTGLDPYGASDPAEFFAVLSETFFTAPGIVYRDFPAVYRQLSAYFRQDPYALLGDEA